MALATAPPLLAALVSGIAPSLDVRYLAVCFPFFLVLMVLGLGLPGADQEAGRRRKEGTSRPVRTALGATLRLNRGLAILVFLAGAGAQLLDPDAGTTPWRAAMAELRRLEPGGAAVWVRPDAHARVVRRYLGHGCPERSRDPGSGRAGWCVFPGVEATGLPEEMPRDVPEVRGSTPRGMGGDGSAAQLRWLVEVEYLVRDQPFADPAWAARPHRSYPEGNGVRISRLVPRSVPPEEGAGSGGPADPPAPVSVP